MRVGAVFRTRQRETVEARHSAMTSIPSHRRRLAGLCALGFAVALAAAGCGERHVATARAGPLGGGTTAAPGSTAAPEPAVIPLPLPTQSPAQSAPAHSVPAPTRPPGVHFSTPQAAMRYLTAAY